MQFFIYLFLEGGGQKGERPERMQGFSVSEYGYKLKSFKSLYMFCFVFTIIQLDFCIL